ncbi:MAG: MFS transporter [Dehalococcoidales bacterium]|nr:MFS transporter [Dehalococcoidales bacterium]
MRRITLVVVSLSFFLAAFMGSAVNIALPSIGRELHMDAVSLGWVTTSFILASVMSLVPFGRLSDIRGRKKILTYGVIIYTISSLLLSFVHSANLLISLRFVQGIGSAMIFATGLAIVTSVFPSGERGKALGISVAMTYSGLSLGPVLGGMLTQHFGWRSIFLATIPLGIIIIILILWKMKGEWAEAKEEKFDHGGAVIYGLTLVGIIYGFSRLPDALGIGLLAAGISGAFYFVRRGIKVKHPLLDIGLFRKNRVFAFSNLATLLNYSALFAVGFLLSLYLQYIKGLDPQNAGLVLVAMPVVQAALSPLAGRLSDRIEPRILASIGMGINAIGLSVLIFVNENSSLGFIIGILVLMGAGFALFTSPNTNAIMSSVKQRFYGVASATMATMRQIGMSFSMGITMLLFTIYIGRVEITPEHYPLFLSSTKIAFIVFTALCTAGIFASLARGDTRNTR